MSSLYAQEELLFENFNNCTLPSDWSVNVISTGNPTWYVGMPQNPASNGASIDGSCMLIIDDDATGEDTPAHKVQVLSPSFDATQYPNINFSVDLTFRQHETSAFNIYVFDGSDYILLKSYTGDQGQTGEQFYDKVAFITDLSFYASTNMHLMFEYDDDDTWAWWAGFDNVRVVGAGEGTNLLTEAFSFCELPDGWTSEIITGEHDWSFGFIDNDNAWESNTMNGSCFAYFDDDGIGADATPSKVRLYSPVFNGTTFSNVILDFDQIFRKYADLEHFAVYIFDGQVETLLMSHYADVGGPQFHQYQDVVLDLSAHRTETMQIIFHYEDGNDWGWWIGIDNVKIYGEGVLNDLCVNAVDITLDADCLSGDNQTSLYTDNQPSCSEGNEAALWYKYEALTTGKIKINTTANYNDVVSVFTGDCIALSDIYCTNRDEFGFISEDAYLDTEQGETYFIRVSGQNGKFGIPRGDLCIRLESIDAFPAVPVNDLCTTAIPLLQDSICLEGNNYDATFDGPQPSRNLKSRADIWYAFQATTTSMEVLSNADFADVLTVYSGDCSALEELASNEYGQQLELNDLVIGETYFLQVCGFFATIEGTVCIELKEKDSAAPANDACFSAFSLPVDGNCVGASTENATLEGPKPSCEIFPNGGVWFQFVAPASGGVQFNSGADFLHTLSVYQGDCFNLEEVFCFNNPLTCNGYVELGGLIAGNTYYIQISTATATFGAVDGNLCLQVLDINSSQATPALELVVDLNCISDGIAELAITATGGSGAYTFLGNENGTVLNTGDDYLVVVQDESGCEQSKSGIVECGALPCAVSATVSTTDANCFGGNGGTAAIYLLSGSDPVTYQWSNGANGLNAQGLAAGTYDVTITDGNGCPTIQIFTISEPSILTPNTSSTNETDAGANDGTATANPYGGTPPYTFEWSTGSTSPSIVDLEEGVYTVTIIDSNDCYGVESVSVNGVSCFVSSDVIATNITCHGENDGIIYAMPQSGVGPFTFVWSTGSTSAIISGLSVGNYSVTVTDANGCPFIGNSSITEPDLLEGSIVAQTDAHCEGLADGTATVIGMGGAPPYTYSWPNGGITPTSTALLAGTYLVSITDASDCQIVVDVKIEEPSPIEITVFNQDNLDCYGDSDGVLIVASSGGEAPYNYNWDDPTSADPPDLNNLEGGSYFLTVTDWNNCTVTQEFIITQPDEINVTVDAIYLANNGSTGGIEISLSDGVAPYTTEWYNNGFLYSNEEDIYDLQSGDYELIVTDANDCSTTEVITVDDIVSTQLPEHINSLSLFPNPTMGEVVVDIKANIRTDIKIVIYDVIGRELITIPEESILEKQYYIDLRTYPSGVYPMKIYTNGQVITKRIIVEKE